MTTEYRNNAPTMTLSEIALWEQRLRTGQLFTSPQGHGTTATYKSGCRCERCTAAERDYKREYRKLKAVRTRMAAGQ